MLLNLLKAKIHRATITEANLAYEGSITIASDLLRASGILPYEQVHVVDVDNGQRFVTYTIPGPAESGCICVNGAAARLVVPGDKVIIIAYAQVEQSEAANYQPRVLLMDEKNRIKDNYALRVGEIPPGGSLK
jgi:aspartate 1-decarboxylase